MILLNGHTLQARDRFRAESMSLSIEERNTTATLTVGPDAPEIGINDWLKDDTEPGAGIVWRVKNVRRQIETDTRTISLEHVIQVLRDSLIFGEVKADGMGGGGGSCTARQAIAYALGRQAGNIWRLGDVQVNPSNPYAFNGDSVYSAIETVTGSLDGVQWEYDLSSLPFTLHIRREPTGFESEMRMSRNISSLSIQIDRSRMYTRHYPTGKNNLHLSGGGYTSRNEATWGVVCRTETDGSIETEAALRAWSQSRLNKHCEPTVTVTVGGIDLSRDTGEPLDRITVGRKCRLPLPEYGTTMTEKVTKISWADKVKEPDRFTVTMANLQEDVAKILSSQIASSSRGGRTAQKKAEEDHAWFVDTTDHVAMVAEAVAGEGAAEDWSRVASIVVDGDGIHQRVVKTEGELVTHQTAIEANEKAITLEAKTRADGDTELSGRIVVEAGRITQEVTDRQNGDSDLSGRIIVEAGRITQEVTDRTNGDSELSGRITVEAGRITQEVTDRENADSTLSGRITTEAGKISLVVEETAGGNVIKAASIVTAVNNAGSSVAISADHVSITGDTKLSGAMTIDGGALVVKKSAVFQGNVTLTDANGILEAKNYVVKSGGHVRFTGTGAGEYYDLTGTNIQGFIKDAAVDGNTLKLWKFTDAASSPSITFSKATSLSGAWSGNRFTVTASPQGNTCAADITHTAPYQDSQDSNKWKVRVYATDPSQSGTPPPEFNPPLNHYITLQSYLSNAYDGSDASHKITANGSYTASGSSIIGFSKVVVEVPSTGGDMARFGSNQGAYYIEAYDSSTGAGVSGSSVQYTLKAGYTAGSGILVDVCDTGGTKIANTASCPIWMTISSGPVNDQGLMNYDTYYGITSGNTILATWKTPPDNSPAHHTTLYQVLEEDVDGSTSTAAYYGKLYDANGNAVFSGKYWYYCTTDIGKNKTVYWD